MSTIDLLHLLITLLGAMIWTYAGHPPEWNCSGEVYDCPDGEIQPWPATAHYFLGCEPQRDPSGLDRDKDLLPCEAQFDKWVSQAIENMPK